KETQQQRSKEKAIVAKEKAMVTKDKPVGTLPSQDSQSGNKILSHSTDREHPEGVDRKKITNLQIQKMKDQQKTLDQKRISKSEEAKEQMQKKKERGTPHTLVGKEDAALKNAKELIKKSKQA